MRDQLLALRELLDRALAQDEVGDPMPVIAACRATMAAAGCVSAPVIDDSNPLVRRITDLLFADQALQRDTNQHDTPEIAELRRSVATLRDFTRALAIGDLAQNMHLGGGMAGALKSLQANLRHLTWQTQRVAEGDFTQRIDFLGDFSFAFNTMVEQLRDMMQQLQQSEERYRVLIEQAPFPIVISRLTDSRVLYINPRALTMFGMPAAEAIGRPAYDFYVCREQRDALLQQIRQGGDFTDIEANLRRKDGTSFWAYVSATATTFDGEPVVFAAFKDISERKRLEDELRASEALHRSIFTVSPEGIVVTDIEGTLQMISPATLRLYGYDDESEVLGQNVFDLALSLPEDKERARARIAAKYQGIYQGPAEFQAKRKDGTTFVQEVIAELIRDGQGRPTGIVFLIRDVTPRYMMEEELRLLSFNDGLTGLYNRRYFETEMQRLQPSRQFPISLLVMDVDGLKRVNDTRGHEAGDRLLAKVGAILQRAFRPEDVVARIGGDEFAVILPGTPVGVAISVIERLEQLIEAHNLVDADMPISLSIGTASGDNLESLEEIFRKADTAMYVQKQQRRQLVAADCSCPPE